jgi:hypothetical protein
MPISILTYPGSVNNLSGRGLNHILPLDPSSHPTLYASRVKALSKTIDFSSITSITSEKPLPTGAFWSNLAMLEPYPIYTLPYVLLTDRSTGTLKVGSSVNMDLTSNHAHGTGGSDVVDVSYDWMLQCEGGRTEIRDYDATGVGFEIGGKGCKVESR